jgi:hypothetical protein
MFIQETSFYNRSYEDLCRSSGSEEMLHNLFLIWTLNIYYCGHMSLSLALILSQMNPVHTLLSFSFKICFNIFPVWT